MLEALEVVRVALHESVMRSGLDEEAISLREITLQRAIKAVERRPRVPRRTEALEDAPPKPTQPRVPRNIDPPPTTCDKDLPEIVTS